MILLGCVVAACGQDPAEPELVGEHRCAQIHRSEAPTQRNVVMIVNDTMRRDAAGIYGGTAATPHFDRFADRNLLFENAFAQAPWTKPSIATLFTSLYPSQHLVISDPMLRKRGTGIGESFEADVLVAPLVTLAEVFSAAGYRTAAFVANPWLKARFGFAQGFEHYEDSFVDEFGAWPPSGEALVEAALDWLRERDPDEPWFLYVHLLDSHGPYGSIDASEAAGLRPRLNADSRPVGRDGERIYRDMRLSDGTPLQAAGFRLTRALLRKVYRIGIERFDRLFGELLAGLRKAPGWQQTAVIVTSDHGEAFFEHGWGLHGHGLHDDEAAIPLAARLPGVTGARLVPRGSH
ncbi:MAG: sulfatase [Myxococcota bacterium]|nr:sulfatase [bacterium]MDP7299722.1 sulfatase [Myxococcota bacterium]MDP7433639.1 sulfatase [Myxococcota bacterium]